MTMPDDIVLDEALGVRLSHLQPTDSARLVEILQDQGIQKHMFMPNPYSASDADSFIGRVQQHLREAAATGRPSRYWCIRDADSNLIGNINLAPLTTTKSFDHVMKIAYYLSSEWRGKGIMPKAVNAVCGIAFESLGVRRVEAGIFAFNKTSGRVLEKLGFHFEGTLRNYYSKPGVEELIDCDMYSMIEEDWNKMKQFH
ncbi:hypothetical protein HK101_010417 [Irineochytrium annulatum]|nr:hypothetical protein HK101_010417 [Irineochytrium annulatum]